MSDSYEMIANWSNSLRQNNDGVRLVAAQTATDLQRRGFSALEALDVMAADHFDIRLAEDVIGEIYNPASPTAAPVAAIKQAMVVPTQYNDVAPFIEKKLEELSPRSFINLLAKSENPILRVSQKSLESFYRLAEYAKKDEHALKLLHKELTPWVEEAMYASVLASENRTAAKSDMEVDLDAGTCSCSRFTGSRMAEFGLACEHLVRAADSTSPHQRLMRAVQN